MHAFPRMGLVAESYRPSGHPPPLSLDLVMFTWRNAYCAGCAQSQEEEERKQKEEQRTREAKEREAEQRKLKAREEEEKWRQVQLRKIREYEEKKRAKEEGTVHDGCDDNELDGASGTSLDAGKDVVGHDVQRAVRVVEDKTETEKAEERKKDLVEEMKKARTGASVRARLPASCLFCLLTGISFTCLFSYFLLDVCMA